MRVVWRDIRHCRKAVCESLEKIRLTSKASYGRGCAIDNFGVKFRRQHPIGSFIVDFCCLEKGLIVELDGSQHVEQAVADKRRTKFLESRGYRVLRFWDNDVLDKFDGVLERISEVLESPHPCPLPQEWAREIGEAAVTRPRLIFSASRMTGSDREQRIIP